MTAYAYRVITELRAELFAKVLQRQIRHWATRKKEDRYVRMNVDSDVSFWYPEPIVFLVPQRTDWCLVYETRSLRWLEMTMSSADIGFSNTNLQHVESVYVQIRWNEFIRPGKAKLGNIVGTMCLITQVNLGSV